MNPNETGKRLSWFEALKKNFDVHDVLRNWNKNPVSIWVLLGLSGFGLILIFWGGKEPPQKQSPVRVEPAVMVSESESNRQQGRLEEELTQTLSLIDGVGSVRVEITLKSGGRRVWERQTRSNKRISQEQSVNNHEEENSDELVLAKDRDGRDAPVLKEELAPEIQGVVVVASGAREGYVRERLINTVMTVLDLPAHRVMVVPGEVKKGSGRND